MKLPEFVFALIFACCSVKAHTFPDPLIAPENAARYLDSCYQAKDTIGFGLFFQQWNNALSPQFDFSDEKERAANEVFAAFFRPEKGIGRAAHWWPNKGKPYVVLPTEIIVSVAGKSDTLRSFRPAIVRKAGMPLYGIPGYESALISFLRELVQPFTLGGDSERSLWLKRWIAVRRNLRGRWEVISQPEVCNIKLDTSLKRAVMVFRQGTVGRRALLLKKGGKWKVKGSRLAWVA